MRQHIKANRCQPPPISSDSSHVFTRCKDDVLNLYHSIGSDRLLVFSLELRELESKLRSAYLNRERAAQIAEKESMRFETMVRLQISSSQT